MYVQTSLILFALYIFLLHRYTLVKVMNLKKLLIDFFGGIPYTAHEGQIPPTPLIFFFFLVLMLILG